MMILKTFASALIGAVVFATVAISGGRDAHAGACTTSGGGVYSCTGAVGADSTQNLGKTSSSTTITTTAPFGINTASGNAFTLDGKNGIDFEDSNLSSIIGANRGISATNLQDGANFALGITTTGTVTGTTDDGIFATTSNSGNGRTNINISAANVSGGTNGINALNTTDGSVTVTASGTVTGTNADGIRAVGDGNFGNGKVTVSAASVSGGANGIWAENKDGGGLDDDLQVTATGDVTGAGGRGIYANNTAQESKVTISAENVTGQTDGIWAKTNGDSLNITAGTVTGTTGGGVRAETVSGNNTATISTAGVSGGTFGIRAIATDDLTVRATDGVSGGSSTGIFAQIKSAGSVATKNLTVTATDVSGGSTGILAENQGRKGNTIITAAGNVTGAGGAGISADTRSFSHGLTISAGDVSGQTDGIKAVAVGRQSGTGGNGDMTITAGSVTGATGDGVHADLTGGQSYIGKLSVTTADVSGGTNGIFARNADSGTLGVVASGPVSGAAGSGISATHAGDNVNTSSSQNLNITATNVSGTDRGILATNNAKTTSGSRQINVTVSGVVSGGTGAGIETRAANSTNAKRITKITLNSGATVGSANGVAILDDESKATITINDGAGVTGDIVLGNGTDTLTVKGAGSLDGSINGGGGSADKLTFTGAAVRAVTGDVLNMETVQIEGSSDVTFGGAVTTGQVKGDNAGTGALRIASTGTVTGTSGDGIDALNRGNTTDLVISAVDVSGAASGILATNNGTGTTSITASGAITGGSGAAIATLAGANGASAAVVLNAGAVVTRTSTGNVITNDESASTLAVNAGASVVGKIALGGGTDDVIFNGGDFSGVSAVDGGNGTDSLTFANGAAAVAGSQVTNIENLAVGSGGDVSFSGTVNANTLRIESGGRVSGSATVKADVTVEAGATVGPGNSPGLMQVLGDVNYMSGSTLALELGGLAFGAEYDRIDVADDGSTAAVEGTATIEDGTIFDIDYYGAFIANLGDAFDVLVADDIDSGMLSAMLFDFSGAALGSGLDWDFNIVDFGGGREALRLIVVSNVTQPPSEVPAPGIMLIFALGLAGLGVARRKRAA